MLNSRLSEAFSESQLENHILHKDINSATDELIKVTRGIIDQIAPIRIVKVKEKSNHIPWYTNELHSMIKDKNLFLADYFYFGLDVFKEKAKELGNKIKHLKRKLKSLYFTEKLNISENDSKKCWKILNDLTQRTESKETVEPDKMSQDKANKFNIYFATVGEEIQRKLKRKFELKDLSELPGFEFKMETQQSIEKMIDNIRNDVAIGHDDIGARIIKDAKPTLAPVLTKIINLSYELNTFPSCMKLAAIKALHKKDDKNEFANYRPISILPTMSKVFERSATQQLVEYLEKNNIIKANQHAYRKGHSTITCLYEVVNH